MGTYEEYLKIRELIEQRIDGYALVAMDMDEARKAAWTRLEGFLAEYEADRAVEIHLAASYRREGVKESIVASIDRDIQEIATMPVKSNGHQARLLLDDIRIVLRSMQDGHHG